jgi:hypothetical protein
MEERNCFRNINNNNSNNNSSDEGDGRRPDLSVSNFNINSANKDLLLDVSVTQSYPGSKKCSLPPTFNRAQANAIISTHHEATVAYNSKIRKYEDAAKQNNYLFQPLIFEANGFIHPQSLQCIKDLASLSSSRFNRCESAVLSYFRNQISVTLNISLARSIQRRSTELINPTARQHRHYAEEYRTAANFMYVDRGRRRRA